VSRFDEWIEAQERAAYRSGRDRLIVSVEFLESLRRAGLELTPDCELRALPAPAPARSKLRRQSLLGESRALLLASQRPEDDPSEWPWSTDPPPRALPPALMPERRCSRVVATFTRKRARQVR
jgi:hypothetical protein